MKIRRKVKFTRRDIDLEVVFDAQRNRWLVRPFGGDPLKVFSVEHVRSSAEHVAVTLAKVFAKYVNADGSCEVYFRNLDGTLSERNTYGRDPKRSRN